MRCSADGFAGLIAHDRDQSRIAGAGLKVRKVGMKQEILCTGRVETSALQVGLGMRVRQAAAARERMKEISRSAAPRALAACAPSSPRMLAASPSA